jgi:hypothetical protein
MKELLQHWQGEAAGRVTAEQYPVRLDLDDAARIHALAEMFPGRSREQIITDLLHTALQQLAASMPYLQGRKVISTDEQGDPVYEDAGLTPRFMELTRRYRKQLESEQTKS